MLKLWQSLLCSTRQSYNVCTASDGLREMPHARCAGRPPWSPLAAAPGAQCGAGWHAHYASKVSSSCALPFAVWRSGGRRPAPVFADPTSLLPLCLLALLAAAGHQAQAEQAAPVASGALEAAPVRHAFRRRCLDRRALPRLPRAGHWSPACRRSAPTYPLNMRSANQGKHSGKEKPSGQPSKRSGAITAVCVGGAVAASAAMALRPGGFLRGYLQDRWEDLEAIELEPGMKKVR